MKNYKLPLIGLGTFLVILSLILLNILGIFSIFTFALGFIAIWRGMDFKENINEHAINPLPQEYVEIDEDSVQDAIEEKQDCPKENDHPVDKEEILGIKMKPGMHTKLLKSIEPSMETLKTMIFWPFVTAPPKDNSNLKKDFKYCRECGTKVQKNAKFCNECGKSL